MNTAQSKIEIRLLAAEESPELGRLAELDTAEPPSHPVLGAIVGGRLVAAESLTTRQQIADPFRPTAEIRALLADRVDQLRGDGPDGRILSRFRRGVEGLGRRGATATGGAR